MADKVATDFLSKLKAKGKEAMSWFKDIVKQTQRAAFPASTGCLLYTSPSPRDGLLSRMPSSA